MDKAGNRSENTDVIFRRLKLELEQFRTVEITGNLAKVEGIFKVEGAIYPDLQFFANGERADVQWSVRTPPPPAERSDEGPVEGEDEAGAAGSAAAGEPAAGEASGEETVELDPGATRTIEFETEIPLARPVNTLSVKYSWKDRTPVSFGKAGTLERVQARAPAITLRTPALDGALKPEEKDGTDDAGPKVIYTREAALALEGDVSPVLDQLDPFRDGKASQRIGEYVTWYLKGLDENLSKDEALRAATDKYAEKWGIEKVIRSS